MKLLWGRLTGGGKARPAAETPPVQARQAAATPGFAPSTVTACHLRTARGLWVGVAGPQAAGSPSLDPAHALLLLRADTLANAGVLLAPDNRLFDMPPDPWRAPASSARVLQTTAPDTVRLKYPVDGTAFLAADPAPSPGLRFEGVGDTMDAAFTLVPVPAAQLSAFARAAMSELGAVVAQGLRAATLTQALRSGALRPELAAALLRLLPEQELESLARTLLDHPAQLASWRQAHPGDAWLGHHLPALARWEQDGRPPAPEHTAASPLGDEEKVLPVEQARATVGLTLTALARRQILPRKRACVLATARDEAPYLLDWISYHLSIGFEHVFIYTNDNADETGAMLATLARHGVVTLIDNARGSLMGAQAKAYAHALSMLPHILDFRWTAVLDIDEYLAFDTNLFAGVGDLIGLQECQSCDAIALCWLMFAAQPHDIWSDASSLVRFERRERHVNQHVKSLMRTRLFWYAQPHFPRATMGRPFVFRTQDGRPHHHPGVGGETAAFAEHPGAEQAWVNHYFLRSADEALWKWRRGRATWPGDVPDRRRDDFLTLVSNAFMQLARPEHLVEDRRILACARGQAGVLAQLLALPGVAEIDQAAKAGFAERLRRNTEAFLVDPLPADAPPSWHHFRDVLAACHV